VRTWQTGHGKIIYPVSLIVEANFWGTIAVFFTILLEEEDLETDADLMLIISLGPVRFVEISAWMSDLITLSDFLREILTDFFFPRVLFGILIFCD
jgi:hypothetical protein